MTLFKAVDTNWVKINHLFHQALECTKDERAEFLARSCGGDLELEKEILSLIATHEEDEQFMEAPLLKRDLAHYINRWQERIGYTFTGVGSPDSHEVGSMIGQVLDGKYRIEQLCGRGGMGIVYRATHLGTGRAAAVKVMAPAIAGSSEFLERFRREARAIGMLNHPNIVDVTDFGLTHVFGQKIAYLVMELLEGQTLAERIREQGKLSLPETVIILRQVAAAIDEAHRAGVFHLDLKPDNIWLQAGSSIRVKVLDFGLADLHDCLQVTETHPTDHERRVETFQDNQSHPIQPRSLFSVIEDDTLLLDNSPDVSAADFLRREYDEPQSTLVSRYGVIMGTPAYMSPEQCRGERLSKASDIYSLGVIAYRMLTGELPFKARVIPPGVDQVIREALAQDQFSRPAHAGAFVFRLELEIGKGDWIRKQARALYKRHRWQWRVLGALAPLPAGLAASGLLLGALMLPPMQGVATFLIFIVLWAAIAFFTLLGQASTIAACSWFTDEKLGKAATDTGLRSILRSVREKTVDLGYGIISASTQRVRQLISRKRPDLGQLPFVSFVGPAILEDADEACSTGFSRNLTSDGSTTGAVTRAETLFASVGSLARRFFPKRILLFGGMLALWQIIFVTFGAWLDELAYYCYPPFNCERPEPFVLQALIPLSMLATFILFRMNLRSSIEQSLLYWSARKVSGEISDEPPAADVRRFSRGVPRLSWTTGGSLAIVASIVAGGQYVKYTTIPYILERDGIETVKAFNLSGVPVPSWSGREGLNAVWVASHPRSVEFMLQKGSSVNHRLSLPQIYDHVTTTPLMSAIIGRSDLSMRYLINRGADLNAQDSKGRTPLMVAAIYHPQAVEQLIRAGADPGLRTSAGTALESAAKYQWIYFRSVREMTQGKNAVQMLLDRGANVDERDDEGRTPLMLVGIENRHPVATRRIAEVLLNAGADLKATDKQGLTALDHAVRNKQKGLTDFLGSKTALQVVPKLGN